MTTLFAMSGAGNTESLLYTLNPADGSILTTIGDTGLLGVTAIALRPSDQALFAVCNNDNNVYKINTTTAHPTLVGSFGDVASSIAFDNTGILYFASTDLGFGTINTTTGAPTTTGSPPLQGSSSLQAVGVSIQNTLYFMDDGSTNINGVISRINSLWTVDPTGPTFTLNASNFTDTIDNPAQPTLAFGDNDVMYGLHSSGGSTQLITIVP